MSIQHPTWKGTPILLGDLVQVDNVDPHDPPGWEEVTAIVYDTYDGTHEFKVGSQYWDVYLTKEQAIAHSDLDDQYWIVGHKPAALSTSGEVKP